MGFGGWYHIYIYMYILVYLKLGPSMTWLGPTEPGNPEESTPESAKRLPKDKRGTFQGCQHGHDYIIEVLKIIELKDWFSSKPYLITVYKVVNKYPICSYMLHVCCLPT